MTVDWRCFPLAAPAALLFRLLLLIGRADQRLRRQPPRPLGRKLGLTAAQVSQAVRQPEARHAGPPEFGPSWQGLMHASNWRYRY
eukprot:SAG22_NODE_14337_length_377_cov_0.737410_1_plen_84_part_01